MKFAWISFPEIGLAHDPKIEISEKFSNEFSMICHKTFELLHSNGDLFRSFDFVSCDSSNSVLFSILFPFYDYSSEGT